MLESLTPRQIVAELDRYIVGQAAAKRATAIAVRNRWRRLQLPEPLRKDVTPKNIILIGPTGVGKTEIARRLAQLFGAPFLKVEVTRYTEVGYYGRDVESMVRDLVEVAVGLVRQSVRESVRAKASERVTERLLELLVPGSRGADSDLSNQAEEQERRKRTLEKFRAKLEAGELEDRLVEISVQQKPTLPALPGGLAEQMQLELGWLENLTTLAKPSKTVQLPIREARKVLLEQETDKLIDRAEVGERAIALAENHGIIFLDEIDKIVESGYKHGPDVSRQGVQRDLLPIVEGTTIHTKYGLVNTDHILFIAAGAFHSAKPSDLMPELQGRFPIRVELNDLTRDDFVRILTEPQTALTRQYSELLKTEGIELSFAPDGIEVLADIAYQINCTTQNIGARRLQTVLERVLEDISFAASDAEQKQVVVDAAYVRARLGGILEREDLTRYIL
jgi:ATP-dependent HslUV protease ATP-binding subunit HslU